MKKYKAAANKYREAIDKDPSCSVCCTNLCTCLNHLKLYKEMNSAAKKCIEVDENSVEGHYWLIMSLKHLKKFKEAFVQSEAALQKFPGNFDLKLVHSEIGISVRHCQYVNCPNQTSDFNTKGLFKCSACKVAYYCSKNCQTKDWCQHKLLCKIKKNDSLETFTTGGQNFDCPSCKKRFLITHLRLCKRLKKSEVLHPRGNMHFFFTFKSKKDLSKSVNKMDFPQTIPISTTQIPQMKEKDIDKEIRRLWKLLLKIPFPRCPPTPEYPKTFNEGR